MTSHDTTPPQPSDPTTPPPAAGEPGSSEEWEQVRRSVAMLPPGAWAMRREQALEALGTLIPFLRRH